MLVIATWNVENLFSAGTEYGPRTVEAYEEKVAALATTISDLAPDVLALQEIGDDAAFDDLVERLPGEWHTARSTAADQRGIRVGYVSRRPLGGTVDVVDFPPQLADLQADDAGELTTRMGRGALVVTVAGDDGDVELMTFHLKSKLISYPGGRFSPRDEDERARYGAYALYRRAAEAVTVRSAANARLDGRGTERAMVVLGDANDTVEAATTQILLGPGGSEIGTPGERVPDQGEPWRLWNVAPLIPDGQRFSRIYRGRRELIDHVLVSRALLERIVGAGTVAEGLPSVHDDPRLRRGVAGSDHAPVFVRLDV